MYGGANWDNLIKTVRNCTPVKAKRIAIKNPNITFFFLCRQYIVINNQGQLRMFNPGDAVFFSGIPWYGVAPQCDAYNKNHMTVAYTTPDDSQQFLNIASYTLADGSPAVDVVCIFGGNYCTNELPSLRANNNNPPTLNQFNPNIQEVLDSGVVKALQDKGITVLLTILNGHSAVGWSQFTSEIVATAFVNYLKTDIVDKYGLDGIDIDDEYSIGIPNQTSLVMVTSIMQQLMPDKIISKALFNDIHNFDTIYKGKKLSDTLDYGWEMTYGGNPIFRLPQYVDKGMGKDRLSLGFWFGQISPNPEKDVQWIKDNGYEGLMVFDFQAPSDTVMMGTLVNALYGIGNWNCQ
ncbi:hypothetical protein LOD99_9820 [Oopsacas minuta]|uniref:GH18 domain-containing protein n=1 Tax=Oopsacas minuta TaxID=111878 RepID=A0AAV7KL88_9METZ|nr:hypothetical protein LOD99_9820 [Oopsacas minuta]